MAPDELNRRAAWCQGNRSLSCPGNIRSDRLTHLVYDLIGFKSIHADDLVSTIDCCATRTYRQSPLDMEQA